MKIDSGEWSLAALKEGDVRKDVVKKVFERGTIVARLEV
jgi:hypothetical protein